MDSMVYRLTYVADSYDLVTHLYFVDRAKAEAMYREKLAKVSFYRNGYIYLHTMKENADGVLDILCKEGSGASIQVLLEAGVRTTDLVVT